MIVRILAEGQLDVPDSYLDELNELDSALSDAINADDEATFEQRLAELLARVRSCGSPLADDVITESDIILPSADSTIHEVREILGEEGLIPG